MIRRLLFSLASLLYLVGSHCNALDLTKDSYADIIEPLIPAVVNISILQKADTAGRFTQDNSQYEEFRKYYEHFGQMPMQEEEEEEMKSSSSGSGFIISEDGHIVTNFHVIDQAEKITITLSNNKKFKARVIGSDSRTDLALLKIDSNSTLPFVNFGNSDTSRVGDFVLTIGNPFGLGGTVTSGIISAQARNINTHSNNIIDNFIQTDAAINRGNSGGPMFNMNGEVIGINFAIFSPTGGSIGLGFAIPSSIAKPIVAKLLKTGRVKHGWLGAMIKSTSETDKNIGATISNVSIGGPAEKAGIKVGDVVLKLDGKTITTSKKLPRIVAETPVGKKILVELLSNGKNKIVTLTIGTIDHQSIGNEEALSDEGKNLYGMTLLPLTPALKEKLNISAGAHGIYVAKVKRKSLADKYGMKKGDVINSANQQTINDVSNLLTVIEQAKKKKHKSVMLLIYRISGIAFLNIPAQ